MTEDEKKWRNHKILVNREKRRIIPQNNSMSETTQSSSSSESTFSDQNSMNCFEKIESIEIEREKGEVKTYSESECNQNAIVPIGRPLTDYRNNLTEIEGIKLNELLTAITFMKTSSEHRITYKVIIEDPVIERACGVWANKCQEQIQKIVRMSKNMMAFRNMCLNDQIALIKYGSVEIYVIRLIMQYDFQNKFWALDSTVKHFSIFFSVN